MNLNIIKYDEKYIVQIMCNAFCWLKCEFCFFVSFYCEKLKIYKLQPIKLGVLRNGIKHKYKFTLKTLL